MKRKRSKSEWENSKVEMRSHLIVLSNDDPVIVLPNDDPVSSSSILSSSSTSKLSTLPTLSTSSIVAISSSPSSTSDVEETKVAYSGDYKKEVTSILDSLVLFPQVIVGVVVEYAWFSWQGVVINQWLLPKKEFDSQPFGLVYFQDRLYVSDCSNEQLHAYTSEGELLETWTSMGIPSTSTPVSHPRALDVYEDNLFIMNGSHLCIINKDKNLIHKWDLPSNGICLKVDANCIYLTLWRFHQVYVYNKTGTIIDKFGTFFNNSYSSGGSKLGEFNQPRGITLDSSYLYVCDYFNHRIQVVDKKNGIFIKEWGGQDHKKDGGLYYPRGILLHGDLIYISDNYRVQVFTHEGIFIQRLGKGSDTGSGQGEFDYPACMSVVKNRLYVADFCNGRIQVFI